MFSSGFVAKIADSRVSESSPDVHIWCGTVISHNNDNTATRNRLTQRNSNGNYSSSFPAYFQVVYRLITSDLRIKRLQLVARRVKR